ncbi:MAG TPA: bacteriohopanetetrol glucosamine biosynthesis glycosyltransferase HpnI [Bryobacteraceae bacterium]
MTWWPVPALVSAAYQLLVIAAALRWKGQPQARKPASPLPLSVLKPVYGRDDRLYAALRSHAVQQYPEYEILFGVRSANDPALADIERLHRQFPSIPMRVIVVATNAPNPKAGVLAQLATAAKHPLLLINDDDIHVAPDYFYTVTAPLEDAQIGLVTCLYRAHAHSFATLLEALGVASDFAPSVMVARLLGLQDFALGATMVLRAETLREIGGFEPISHYLADDYELGRRVAATGLKIAFAPAIVDTSLSGGAWRDVWRHQLRWSRTIRVSRAPGYFGSVITHTTIWALVASSAGYWQACVVAFAARFLAAWIAGAAVLKDAQMKRSFWLLPLRDIFAFAVWTAGCFGSTVYWRGLKMRLNKAGRIQK